MFTSLFMFLFMPLPPPPPPWSLFHLHNTEPLYIVGPAWYPRWSRKKKWTIIQKDFTADCRQLDTQICHCFYVGACNIERNLSIKATSWSDLDNDCFGPIDMPPWSDLSQAVTVLSTHSQHHCFQYARCHRWLYINFATIISPKVGHFQFFIQFRTSLQC